MTILALHGWGASAHDLIGLSPIIEAGEALVLCPQGPVEVPVGPQMKGFGWFPIAAGAPPDPGEFQLGAVAVKDFLEEAKEIYPIDPRKIVVLGFSQGGVMAYDLVLRNPGEFAGLAALSSWLPETLAGTIPKSPEHENFPVLVLHGTEDPMIPIDRARESRDALLPLGVSLTYREHEMEHGISPEALRDLVMWIREKVASPIIVA